LPHTRQLVNLTIGAPFMKPSHCAFGDDGVIGRDDILTAGDAAF
jgi:hypothetical protein